MVRRPLLRSALLIPPSSTALALAFAAAHTHPPAGDAARLCVGIAAGLLLVNLFAWAVRDGAGFGREERLCAFVILVAVSMGYYFAREAIAEREFDAIVEQQEQDLVDSAADLSHEIIAYVDSCTRTAPPAPQAASTWDRDEERMAEFEDEAVAGYAEHFTRRVWMTRAALTLRNFRDRDLDALYQRPDNLFQIRMIGERFGVLAERLRRAIAPAK